MSLTAIEPGTCRTLVDFTDPDEFARWEVINDGVMGGLSKGHIEQAGDALSFTGTVNTNGGGLSCVHPGMYGIFTLVEAVRQLRGEAGDRQIDGAELVLAHGNGGVLSSQVTNILGTEATL